MDQSPNSAEQSASDAKPKTRWTRRRVFCWTLSILLLAFLSWIALLLSWQQATLEKNKKLLAEAIAEAERNDPRWRWEDIEADREPIPDERNSARILEEIRWSFSSGTHGSIYAKRADESTLLEKVEDNRFPDGEDRMLLKRALDHERAALDLALKLVDFPLGRYEFQLPDNPFDGVGSLHSPILCGDFEVLSVATLMSCRGKGRWQRA